MKEKARKALWYMKQLLPLTYVSEYSTDEGRFVSVFKMWLGKPFAVKHWPIRTS